MNQNAVTLFLVVVGMALASIIARRDLIRQRLRYMLAIAVFGLLAFGIAQKFTDQPKLC